MCTAIDVNVKAFSSLNVIRVPIHFHVSALELRQLFLETVAYVTMKTDKNRTTLTIYIHLPYVRAVGDLQVLFPARKRAQAYWAQSNK